MGLADSAVEADRRVNELQINIDGMVNHVIARRQPTAVDLRLIMGGGQGDHGHRAHRR